MVSISRDEVAACAARRFRSYVEWISRHPRLVIVGVVAVTALLAGGASRLRVVADLEANLPTDSPYVAADREIRESFGGRKPVALGFIVPGGSVWTPENLAVLAELSQATADLPDVIASSVVSLASPKATDLRADAEGIAVTRILERPPTSLEGVDSVREAYERNRSLLGPIVARGGEGAVVYVDFVDGVADEQVYRVTKHLVAGFEQRHPELAFFLTSAPSVNHFLAESARRTLGGFFFAVIVIMATLFLAFRSVQGMVLPILTGVVSSVWGLGVMGFCDTPLDGWNALTPILILAIAAGHSIQILKRFGEEFASRPEIEDLAERSRMAVVEATYGVGPIMAVAGSVAAGSFALLALFGIPSIRAFGSFTAIGIVSAIVLELSFVPAYRTIAPPPRSLRAKAASRADRYLSALGESLVRPSIRNGLYGATLVVVLAALGFSTRIEARNSFRSYLAEGNEARVGWETMEHLFGGMMSFTVLVETADGGSIEDPAVLTWMAGLGEALRETSGVTYAVSIADVVRRLHRAMNGDAAAFDVVPDDRALVAQYLFLYGMSTDPEDLARLRTEDGSRALLQAALRSDETADALSALHAFEAYVERHPLPVGVSARTGGSGIMALATNQSLMRGKIVNVLQIALMIYLISSLILGSAIGGLFVLLPLLIAVAAIVAVLGAFGIWLNVATATVASMSLGLGADYAIYLIYRLREESRRSLGSSGAAAALASSGKAILCVAVAISAGFASLGISDFHVNRLLAGMVPFTMAASCLAALTVMPAALLHFRPRFVFGPPTRLP